jgi:hypothetical protein
MDLPTVSIHCEHGVEGDEEFAGRRGENGFHQLSGGQ